MTTTAAGGRLSQHSEQDPLKTEARPFVRFPHAVARDTRLGPNGLVYLAYRATFVGDYALHDVVLLGRPIVRGEGLGRDAIERARRQARDAGYLQRRQGSPGADGRFGYAVERLSPCALDCGASSKAGQIIVRDWFDGMLSLKEMATYLYLRAGTGRGRATYAKELAKRFGWSLPTARRVIAALTEFRLVVKSQRRAGDGRMRGAAYVALIPVLWSRARDGKIPGHGLPGHGFSGHILNSPLHALPSEEPSLRTSKLGSYTSRQREAPTPEEAVAFSSIRLLGWIEADGWHDVLFDQGVDEDALGAIGCVADDHDLRRQMRAATAGRVHPEILSPAGLLGIRTLAAFVLVDTAEGESLAADAALAKVLDAIRDRIGSRPGAWLNSLALVGKRLLWPAWGGDGADERLYGAGGEQKKVAPRTSQCLEMLKLADGARILGRNLYRKPEGLEALLREYGHDALDTIKSVLTGAMIHDSKVGQVRSWEYFRGPLEDERCKAELAATGMRPGDYPGWRYAHRNGRTGDA